MGRLTTLATNRPRRVLAAAGVLFVIAAVLGLPVTGMLGSSAQDFEDPASQYERTNAAIQAATGQIPYYNVAVLLRSRRELKTGAAAQDALGTLAPLLAGQHGFQRVLDYSATRSRALLSRDGRETVVLAAYATATDATSAIARVRIALSKPPANAKLAGIGVRFGGYALTSQELNERTTSDLGRAELLAFPLLLLLSFWFFRGLVAALLPLLVGGFAIVLTFLALRVIDQFTPISVFSLNLVSGMGLGLGIDYSLFVLYRYREELAGGADVHEAIERTLRTAGRTVLFSCLTVAAAMTSLLVFPIRFLSSMGIGGAVVALCDGAVALLVLPAVLIVLGPRVNALSPAWLQRRAARTARAADGRRLVAARARCGAPTRPRRAGQRGRPARRGDPGAAPAVHLTRSEPAARERGKSPGRNCVREELPRRRGGSDRNRAAWVTFLGPAPRRCCGRYRGAAGERRGPGLPRSRHVGNHAAAPRLPVLKRPAAAAWQVAGARTFQRCAGRWRDRVLRRPEGGNRRAHPAGACGSC